MNTRTMARLLAVLAVAVLGFSACGDDGDDTASDETAATEAPAEEAPADEAPAAEATGPVIKDFAFSSLEVAASAAVTVTNQDSVTHTFTADDGSFDTGEVAGGENGEFTAPAEPGTYPVHCEIHATMKGDLVVS